MKALKKQIPIPAALRLGLLLAILAGALLPGAPVQALPAGVPLPGGTFEKSSGLGLTGLYNAPVKTNASTNFSNVNGVKLDLTRQGVYYFYFYLEKPSTVTLWIYTNQALGKNTSQVLYDSKRKEVTHTATTACEKNTQPCTAILVARSLPAGAYYLKTILPAAKGGWAYLMTSFSGLAGDSAASALPWYNQDDLYGQIPAATANQWYKLNLAAGGKYTLKLTGTSGSNLNVYIYSDSSASKPIASGASGNYPESLQVSVPGRSKFVYMRVENAKKTNAEYFVSVAK